MIEMQIGVIGINHKLANLKLRETLARICQTVFSPINSMHFQHELIQHHLILLSTCNRTEIYFSSDELSETHTYLLNILRKEIKEEFDQKLYSYFGSDCFTHLIRVTVGLDSAIPAETEIQGQVKVAYETAAKYQRLPRDLHILFQKSLAAAKKIRHEINFEKDIPQLEQAIFTIGNQYIPAIENASVLFVGVSSINQKILRYLLGKELGEITVCNRTHCSAQEVAHQHTTPHRSVKVLEWHSLKLNWHTYDWIIFGTKSPEFLLKKEDCHYPFVSQKLLMDLSVPRNIDPLIKDDSRVNLLNIDELNQSVKTRKKSLNSSLGIAEEMAKQSASHSFSHLKRTPVIHIKEFTA
jgi:glutamyl-tRNA reductase